MGGTLFPDVKYKTFRGNETLVGDVRIRFIPCQITIAENEDEKLDFSLAF